MTDQELNQKIAEYCGWKATGRDSGIMLAPDGHFDYPPDYVNDLNAMHCAELQLKGGRQDEDSEMSQYIQTLIFVCADSEVWDWDLIHATARQRAEAFVKTLGNEPERH